MRPQKGDEEAKEEERSPAEKDKNDGEFNEEWKEYQSSGKWGNLSLSDIIIAVVVLIICIVGILVVVFVVFADGSSSDSDPSSAFASPTMAPTLSDAGRREEGLQLIRFVSPETSFPDTPEELANGVSAVAQRRAAKWVIWDDDTPVTDEFFLFRYALATLYFSTDGPNWADNQNWLTSPDTCSWNGLVCSFGDLIDIDLSDNNLNGPIPVELSLLFQVKVFRMMNNKLSGVIPYEHFAMIDDLTTLRLDNNPGLVGQLSLDLLKNGNICECVCVCVCVCVILFCIIVINIECLLS